jgi:hypothetical protein
LKPRDFAAVAGVALVGLFAAVDAVRPDAPAPAPRVVSTPLPAPPGPTSRHVQKLLNSDFRLQNVRASRSYCRRDLAVLCSRDDDGRRRR